MQSQNIGKSKEDYLEAILMQIDKNGACRVTDVANQLGFSKPSVSVALKKLEDDGYVEKCDWRVVLTEKGEIIARRMLDKHHTFYKLFVHMGIDDVVAEHEACQVEHIISDDSFARIVAYLTEAAPELLQ